MKTRQLSTEQLSSFCLELSLLLHGGVGAADGISLMAQEAKGQEEALFKALAADLDQGVTLSRALKNSGRFPGYLCGLVEVGERSGRTEEALSALSAYYDHRTALDRQLRTSLLSPAVLLLLMLVVIVVLLSQVLPVFNDVYASLGGQLTGLAGGLLDLGRGLDAAMPALCVLLGLAVVFLAVFAVSGAFRDKLMSLWRRLFGDRGLSRQMSDARFAQALAMGLKSGLPLEEAIALAGDLEEGLPAAQARCQDCLERLGRGEDMAAALGSSGLLPASACRLLALGQRSGAADTVMEEVARRLSEAADSSLESKIAKVEPALVLVTSLLVGIILLSVMLPLMHIMTAIG